MTNLFRFTFHTIIFHWFSHFISNRLAHIELIIGRNMFSNIWQNVPGKIAADILHIPANIKQKHCWNQMIINTRILTVCVCGCACMCNLIVLYMYLCQYIMGRKVFDFRSKTKQSFNKFFFLLNRRNVVHRYNYQTATPISQKGIPFLIFIDNVVLRIQKHFIRFKRPNIFLIASIFYGDIIMLFTNKRWTVLSSHSLTSGLLMIILKSYNYMKWSVSWIYFFSLKKKTKRHYKGKIKVFANSRQVLKTSIHLIQILLHSRERKQGWKDFLS